MREKIFPKLGSSIPGRIEFPLTKGEKIVGRTDRIGLEIEQTFNFEHTKFAISFKNTTGDA